MAWRPQRKQELFLPVRPKPRRKFGEPTYGNSIRFMIDAEETFTQMYQAMGGARKAIYIANYDIDPQLRFVRKPHRSVHDNSTRLSYPLQKLLLERAENGVDVKIIVWEPRPVLRLIPGADERGIDGRADDVKTIAAIASRKGLKDRLMVKIDDSSPTFTSAHHEKLVIVDNQIAFCGGLDLSKGKWDTSKHEYDNRLRDSNSEPWHDVHLMVRGPVVWDFIFHFHQRWLYSSSHDAPSTRKLRINSNYTTAGQDGDIDAVAIRTWKELNRHGGIRAWYATMFRQAEKSIYIENQFPFQDSLVTKLLEKQLQLQPGLRVIIVGPMEPNLPGLVGSIIAKVSVNDVRSNLASLRKVGAGRVETYSLISQDASAPERRRQIYVHSKLMVVDDKHVTVGSANLDKNGMADSSEFNIGLSSQSTASELRARLWSEHLCIKRNRAWDFEEGFFEWKNAADENGRRVKNNEPIKSHVYYYNFEEMNMPPPYAGAEKSNKFALI